jgi:hypothetical protein
MMSGRMAISCKGRSPQGSFEAEAPGGATSLPPRRGRDDAAYTTRRQYAWEYRQ